MSKRFTSLLVGALAAVLLGVPAQAQTVAKRGGNGNGTTFISMPSLRALPQQLQESKEFAGLSQEKQDAVLGRIEREREAANLKNVNVHPVTAEMMNSVLNGGNFVMRAGSYERTLPVRIPMKAASETVDANGIITAPAEGEHKYYNRAGGAWKYSGGSVQQTTQSGMIELVETADGTVYIKDIVYAYQTGAWVKGTKNGNTITVNAGQPLAFNTNYNTTLSIYWGEAVATAQGSTFQKGAGDSFTFEIDGNDIKLQGTNENLILSVFWDDDNSWSGNGDYESVWTLNEGYEPSSTELVEVPADLVTAVYKMKGISNTSTGSSAITGNVNVGFDGNDVYVQGLFSDFPTSWIKGTLENNIVTFKSLQFLGNYSSYNIWMIGATLVDQTYEMDDFKMVYDADAQTLTAVNDVLANASDTEIYYLRWFSDVVLTNAAGGGEPTAKTGAPVDELPYKNTFDTEDEQAQFGVIDSNDDGRTWAFNEDGEAFYSYDSTNPADDWFVSPAVYLEKGKGYSFSIDVRAKSSSFAERIEVKMGAAPKASTFTQQVIAPTDVTWSDGMKTLTNDAITVEESGYYHFGVHAISDADKYYLIVDNFLVEKGAEAEAPSGVTDVTVESVGVDAPAVAIQFTAPAVAINGNALSELTKIELIRDEKVIYTFTDVTPGQVVTYIDDQELSLGNHTYQLLPYNNAGAGVKSDVYEVFASSQLSIPFTASFADASTFGLFSVVDANADGTTWTAGSNYAQYRYNSNNNADDYLILAMPVKLAAGQEYSLTAQLATNTNYAERFEVLLGTAPTVEAMKQVIIEPTDIQEGEVTDYDQTFEVSADGEYYVAVHAISDADMHTLYLYSLTVEKGLKAEAPGAPAITSVVADPFGVNKATVTVIAPVENYGGAALTANIPQVKLYRNGVAVNTFTNVRPGQTLVFVDYVDAAGVCSYQAIPYDENGDRGVKSDVEKTFVGLDVPQSVANVVTAETTDGLLIKWDPVTEGANGGALLPGSVTYAVHTGEIEEFLGFQFVVLDEPFYTTNDCYAVVDYEQTGDQTLQSYFITASNEAGRLSDDYASVATYYAGAPYVMPFEEHFVKTGFNYSWYIVEQTTFAGYDLSEDASDGDAGAILMMSTEADETFSITPGKIEMRQGNPTLVIDVKGDGSAKNLVRIGVQGSDGVIVDVVAIKPTTEFKTYKISLAQFANDEFIKPIIAADFKEEGSVIIDNVKISDMLEYNLAATIDAPKSINAGETAHINLNVRNLGEMTADSYTVKLFAGDQQLLSEKVNEALASFAVKTFTADYVSSIFDEGGNVTLRAEVEFDLDLDEEDNIVETEMNVLQSTAAVPENVKAEKTGNGVKLSWDAPTASTGDFVTEDFENGLNGWTMVDADGDGQSWEHHVNVGSGNYTTHSGDGIVHSASWKSGLGALTPDNWLISPMAVLNGTFSFWAVGQDASYAAEHFAVFVSTTSATDLSTFVKVSSEFVATGTMTEYTVDLSSYAGQNGWIAIRHYNVSDQFELVVDDITYSVGGNTVVAYNVYVDGELFDTTTETSIELNGVSASSTFAVSAVYSNGAESRPVVVVINGANQEITAIEQLTGNNQPVDIYSLDGRLVRQQATDLNGLKGVFVIQGRKVVVK